MPSAGQQLQSERLRRNRTIADIADATRINARYIAALERDDVSQLPGAFFYKAFLRQYAQALALDSAETERILRDSVSVEEVDPVPVFNHMHSKAATGESTRWAPPVGIAVLWLIAVLAGGGGLYALWQRVQARSEAAQAAASIAAGGPAAAQPASSQSALPAGTPGSAQTTPSQPAAATAPVSAAAAGNPSSPQSARAETSVEIVALEPAWVQLSSEGKTVYIGTLNTNESRQFRVAGNARLLTGNAGGLDIRLNGKPIGSIGPRGQIKTVIFDEGSFRVSPGNASAGQSSAAQGGDHT